MINTSACTQLMLLTKHKPNILFLIFHFLLFNLFHMEKPMSAQLFVVATPIGHLDDMSYRAIQVLKSVSLIAAEDTRTSAQLLKHFNIQTPLTDRKSVV